MISITFIENVIDKKVIHSKTEVEWEGKTIEELAPKMAIGCIDHRGKPLTIDDEEWGKIPVDGEITSCDSRGNR